MSGRDLDGGGGIFRDVNEISSEMGEQTIEHLIRSAVLQIVDHCLTLNSRGIFVISESEAFVFPSGLIDANDGREGDGFGATWGRERRGVGGEFFPSIDEERDQDSEGAETEADGEFPLFSDFVGRDFVRRIVPTAGFGQRGPLDFTVGQFDDFLIFGVDLRFFRISPAKVFVKPARESGQHGKHHEHAPCVPRRGRADDGTS